MKIYIAGLLVLIIYLPIFLFMTKKDFRSRFSNINSKKFNDVIIEVIAGILYFLIIFFSFFEPIKINWITFIGILFYLFGLVFTYRGYYIFYKEKELITKNIFSLSRNPTYFFGLTAIFGIVIMTNSFLILILHLCLLFLTDKIIINEEKYLMKKYGKKYLDYCKKVRRYI